MYYTTRVNDAACAVCVCAENIGAFIGGLLVWLPVKVCHVRRRDYCLTRRVPTSDLEGCDRELLPGRAPRGKR